MYTLLSETTPVARVPHQCIWCGEVIEKGTRYHHERSIYDGHFQNHKWHPECLDAFHDYNEVEFNAGENERPPTQNEKFAKR